MKKRYLFLAAATVLLFLIFRFFLPLVLPFVLAYFFAKMVSPVIRFLTDKLHWKQKVCAVLVVVTVVLAVGGFLFYVISVALGQAVQLLQKMPVYGQMLGETVEDLCCRCDRVLKLDVGTSYQYVEVQTENMYGKIGSDILPAISSYAFSVLRFLAKFGGGVFIFFLSTLLILMDEAFPRVHKKLRPVMKKLKTAGFAYIKAQGILMFIIAAVTSAGLMIVGNDYAVLLGIGIAVFDAFPIVGSGIILVPWALFRIFAGDYFEAAVLLTVFVAAAFLREILEPKLFGKEIGMKPLFVLIAVYVGVELFQLGGVILGPIALAILKAVNDTLAERGME